MLAYVIIAIELAILYTVFWYVFLREPKPYRIKGNPWGAYNDPKPAVKGFAFFGGRAQAHGPNCGCQADQDAQIRRDNAIYEEWNATSTSAPLTAGELIRSQSRGVERVTQDMARPGYSGEMAKPGHYVPNNPTEQYRHQAKHIPAFLAELGDRLNRINVKIP